MANMRWSVIRGRRLLALLTALMLAVPRAVLACPVCFGQSDSPMAQGVNMGVFFLLGVVVAVLAGFAAFFIYLARRARTFADDGV
jgi:uncharacterized integral membrane protein